MIGGGIAGCTIAYEAARRGLTVTLLERGALAGQASGRNMGLLLNQVEPEVVQLMRHSLDVYHELEEAGAAFELREHDQMLIAADEGQMEMTRLRADALRGIGVEVELVDPITMRREMPGLADTVVGGARVRSARALDPGAATRAFAELARAAGARILAGTRAAEIRVKAGRVQGVLSDEGMLSAGIVVVAAGPWLYELAGMPRVSAGRGWVLLTGPLPFRMPWIVEEMSWPDQDRLGSLAGSLTMSEVARGHDQPLIQACAVAPLPSGRALVGTSLTASLRGVVEGVDMPRQIATRALALLPGLSAVDVTAAWSGLRPLTPDGMPLAGPCGPEGLWVHGGHGSIGMMAAPATARWLVDAIVDASPPPELARFDPSRF